MQWFSKLSWSTPALSPSSDTPDSTRPLIRRDFKNWSGMEKLWVGRKYDACQIHVKFSSGSS